VEDAKSRVWKTSVRAGFPARNETTALAGASLRIRCCALLF